MNIKWSFMWRNSAAPLINCLLECHDNFAKDYILSREIASLSQKNYTFIFIFFVSIFPHIFKSIHVRVKTLVLN